MQDTRNTTIILLFKCNLSSQPFLFKYLDKILPSLLGCCSTSQAYD